MFPLEQFQLEHGQIMFLEQIAPLVCLRNKVWTMWNREHVQTGRGLARRPLSPRRPHQPCVILLHVAQYLHNKSYCADWDVCRFKIWANGYREHFPVLAIWMLMYRELVSRTFSRVRVPRTYMNGLWIYCHQHHNWQIWSVTVQFRCQKSDCVFCMG